MEQSRTRKRPARKASAASRMPPMAIITESELAHLGEGEIAYIRQMSNTQARKMFPGVKGLPKDIILFALHSADGTPLALTDSLQAAVGHAVEGELEIASVH